MADAVPMVNIKALLTEREDMDAGVVSQLRSGLGEGPKQFVSLRDSVDTLQSRLDQGKGDAEKTKLKLGVGSFFMGRMNSAAEHLKSLKTPLAKFYYGRALNELGKHDDALAALDAAGKAGYAAAEVSLHRCAALRGMGKASDAHTVLKSLDKFVQSSAEFQYQLGALLLSEGKEVEAIGCFEKAVEQDPRHGGALFRLAYFNDKHGNDDEAIALYERCLLVPPAREGVLINLGILYEDHEQFDKACRCYDLVRRFSPGNIRATLYYRDAAASRSQSVDDGGERDRRSQDAVLVTPITDFELSVRARNCLKRMNIRTLGELVLCTEQQLLASKNFGETSLQEIKDLLTVKGLRLGMSPDSPRRPHAPINPDEFSPAEQAMLSKPVGELNLSVRARKCMARLGITTIAELIGHTADELLECKNFGVTSLVEVKEKLTTINLKLRGD